MAEITLSATQMACSWEIDDNIARASAVCAAAADGAQIILLQELFETPYFCVDQDSKFFSLAKPRENHPLIQHFTNLAKELGVVLPVSFLSARSGVFNSLVVADADGTVKGSHRKSYPPKSGLRREILFRTGEYGVSSY